MRLLKRRTSFYLRKQGVRILRIRMKLLRRGNTIGEPQYLQWLGFFSDRGRFQQ